MSTPSFDSSAPVNAATTEPTDIRGLKPLEAFRYPPAYYVGSALIFLLLLTLLVWGIYRLLQRRSKAALPPPPPEPLDRVILRRLDRVRSNISTQPLRRGYFDVSEIFRDYLEGRYNFPASDWTTEEIFSYGNNSDAPLPMEIIRDILIATDQVKFAGWMPETTQLLALINQVEEFVRGQT